MKPFFFFLVCLHCLFLKLILVLRIWMFELKGIAKVELEDENCEEGAEECLGKKTLVAHLDYIYTQKGDQGQHN